MNKVVATIGLVAGIGVGAFSVGSILPVRAQEDPPVDEASGDPAATSRPGRGEILRDALDGLVADGTLTQEQADAVVAAVKAEAGEYPRHPRLRHRILAGAFNVAAETIGVSVDDLKAAVRDGKSVAEVAEENGVDPQTVIDAIVQAASDKLDEAVASGRIDEARADAIKAKLVDAATRFVNFTRPGGD